MINKKPSNIKTLSIVFPVYNESGRLFYVFNALNNWTDPQGFKLTEIIFVNDGSTDNTLEIIKNTKMAVKKTIITYAENKGKGYAVKKGMLKSKSDYTLLSDSDISTPLEEINKLLPLLSDDGNQIVFGTRKNGKSTTLIHQSFIRENMGKVYTKITQVVLGLNITDFTCGFKLFSKQAKNRIFSKAVINRWSYDSEIAYLAKKMDIEIIEKAVTWSNKKGTKVDLFKDSFDSFRELLKIRLIH